MQCTDTNILVQRISLCVSVYCLISVIEFETVFHRRKDSTWRGLAAYIVPFTDIQQQQLFILVLYFGAFCLRCQ